MRALSTLAALGLFTISGAAAAQGYGPPPGGGTPPPAGGPPPAGAAYAGPPPPPPAELAPERSGVVLIPRVGILLGGSGEQETDCDGSACPTGTTNSDNDYDDISGPVALEFDVLGHMTPNFRLGGGLLFLPKVEVDPEASLADDFESGKELDLVFILEGVLDASPTVGIALRGFVGPAFLFKGGDLEDAIDDADDACSASKDNGTVDSCDVSEGPFVGYTFGFSAGAIFQVGGGVGLRADLMFQIYDISTGKSEAKFPGGGSLESTLSAAGTRAFLMAGVEL